MNPIREIARIEAQRWVREFYRENSFSHWSYIGGIVTVLAVEFVLIAFVL